MKRGCCEEFKTSFLLFGLLLLAASARMVTLRSGIRAAGTPLTATRKRRKRRIVKWRQKPNPPPTSPSPPPPPPPLGQLLPTYSDFDRVLEKVLGIARAALIVGAGGAIAVRLVCYVSARCQGERDGVQYTEV